MNRGYALEDVVGAELTLDDGTTYRVRTRIATLDRGVADTVGSAAGHTMRPGHLLLLADHHTFPLAGDTVVSALRNAAFDVHRLLLDDAHDGRVEADDSTLKVVEGALGALPEPRAGVVALGSGTLNDLAKLSAFRAGLPYGVVATAASMNGYTSAIAAILSEGVKRTIPCAGPRFVVADLDIIAAAPIEMTRAGFGDLMSKPVSSGDWLLSHLLLGEPFHRLPVALVESAFSKVQSRARGVGSGDPEAVGCLMEALLLSGISMASAGSSAPASGGEHLISHLWDMTAWYRGRTVGLHGAQVGVATLITATLYRFLAELDHRAIDIERRLAALEPFGAYSRRLTSLPAEIYPSVLEESRAKHPTPAALRARLESTRERWTATWERLEGNLQSPETLRESLGSTGAPTTARELGIPEEELREAYRIARDIRRRYTVLDLAWEIGVLDALEAPVLTRSGVLG